MKCFLAFFVVFLLLTGCTLQPTTSLSDGDISTYQSTVTTPSTTLSRQDWMADIFSRSSILNADDLIKTTYPQNELLENIVATVFANTTTSLYNLDQQLPVECIRTFDDSYLYCVYRSKEGGRIFAFFRHIGEEMYLADRCFYVNPPFLKLHMISLTAITR